MATGPAGQSADAQVKVVSWNIRYGIDIEGAVAAICDVPELQQPDALLLQEMDREGTEKLANALGLNSVYASSGVHARTGRDFGNAVLSPAPLRDRLVHDLPHQARVGGHPRIALSAVAELGVGAMTLCSVHTETPALAAAKRQEQFAAVAGLARGWPTPRSVVGGDFNTVTRRGIQKLVGHFEAAAHIRVSIEAVTMRRGGQDFALDHIFARGLWPVTSGVVHGLAASDHSPAWAVLEPGWLESADQADERGSQVDQQPMEDRHV